MDIIVIIPAGGMNSRYNEKISKLTEEINGISIIEHSINAFLQREDIKQIIVPCNSNYSYSIKSLIPKDKKVKIIDGGPSRAESVKNGFNEITIPCSHVLIHDAARPNIKPSLIDRIISATESKQIIIPGISVTDTIKEINNKQVVKTLNRKTLISTQTPQCFKFNILNNIYKNIDNINEYTDESAMAEKLNYTIDIINGSISNIKLTYPTDLEMLKTIMLPSTKSNSFTVNQESVSSF